MWEKYSGKHILITGGSGFLGTALVHRIITKAPTVGRIYIICRNGRLSLEEKWKQWLHNEDAEKLCKATNITVLDDDIVEMDMYTTLSTLQPQINVIIHAASSINLARPLGKIKDIIIGASEKLAGFALECVCPGM
ncbi:hypothetical protein VTN96DRAFT_5701 [Rasamsonia emersonii]|uniref:Fatty acyl-CoA reductase n=1 Tax=Rasamsonia emersonii (strain ATCC 16479 / CBS 393.64 / IMI 116815) TaxID=1408163 RepID=A0A0F4YU19_RASE3|nr:hypothetical protein T310_4197 [Rasamsonia emersonii CBS 393.64]KKA21772.1 hypothetical protein T310_4197 [Rasamsonia emersonii CBS 393.64]